MAYIDLNMARAGVVADPIAWKDSGYHETQCPPIRCSIINHKSCLEVFSFESLEDFQLARQEWVNAALAGQNNISSNTWLNSLAVGNEKFVEQVKDKLGIKTKSRKISENGGVFSIQEEAASYTHEFAPKIPRLSFDNMHFWQGLS